MAARPPPRRALTNVSISCSRPTKSETGGGRPCGVVSALLLCSTIIFVMFPPATSPVIDAFPLESKWTPPIRELLAAWTTSRPAFAVWVTFPLPECACPLWRSDHSLIKYANTVPTGVRTFIAVSISVLYALRNGKTFDSHQWKESHSAPNAPATSPVSINFLMMTAARLRFSGFPYWVIARNDSTARIRLLQEAKGTYLWVGLK